MMDVGVHGTRKRFEPPSDVSSGTGEYVVVGVPSPRVVGILAEPTSGTYPEPDTPYPSEDETEAGSAAVIEDMLAIRPLFDVDPYMHVHAVGKIRLREADYPWPTHAGFAPRVAIEGGVKGLVAAARDERFEIGMDSSFSRGLDELSRIEPRAVLAALTEHVDHLGHEVFAEVMRWTSRQPLSVIRDFAVDLLERGLTHESSFIRDAAALGLAELLEEKALDRLRGAYRVEKVPELREDIGDLIQSLECDGS